MPAFPRTAAFLFASLLIWIGFRPALAGEGKSHFKVFLDPGHGGEDVGAEGKGGVKEKDIVLALAQLLAQQLRAAGFEVQSSRGEDVFIPLRERARVANEAGSDLFVSLHVNAARSRGAKGSEVFFLSLNGADRDATAVAKLENASVGGQPALESVVDSILDDMAQKAYLQDSERLAVRIQQQLNRLGGIKERGVKQAPFAVLRGAAMPAVLVETAFISNPKEAAKLKDPAFRKRVAEAITAGIRAYCAHVQKTPRRRTPSP